MDQEPKSTSRLCIVRFDAEPPVGGLPEDPDVAGAYVVCYVNDDSFYSAIEQAAHAIKAVGWRIGDPEFAELVEIGPLLEDDETSQYAREALEDGLTMIYHCYPAEAE